MHASPPIRVVAAVISRGSSYLLTRRPEGSHLGGYWEFPGGKLESGESPADALARELREEIGVEIADPRELTVLTHRYPERTVELTFLETAITEGRPEPLEVADVGWYEPWEMPELPILPADLPVVQLLAQRLEPARQPGGRSDA